MLTLYNSLGKKLETFSPVNPDSVNIFTCGPSVYQRSHIGNFRTFLFEDILVRYLEYSGYRVRRGMNFTDIEDKALKEAYEKKMPLRDLTSKNIETFTHEMQALKIKIPDYLPRASDYVDDAVKIIEMLIERGAAYRYGDNIYFDPMKYPGFGKIFDLDLKRWPSRKIRFHRDTYIGLRWNLGDFILWHGCRAKDRACWDTAIGRGWPAWNIQDPSMVCRFFDETLSIYCGGIDNLIRHHDYSAAILESIRPYPMSRFWLHCHHLYVNGKKMSKSTGNIIYTDMLLDQGYLMDEVRFFLIYGHYRKNLNFSSAAMSKKINRFRALKERIREINKKADTAGDPDAEIPRRIRAVFSECMDDDLNVKGAVDGMESILFQIDPHSLPASKASSIMEAIRKIDSVLQVLCQLRDP
jgi:cysteinyl-tRNA synthetase